MIHKLQVKIIFYLLLGRCLLFSPNVEALENIKLALAITTPSLTAPESAFGHAFLILYDKNGPELSSIAISAVANAQGNSRGFGYLLNGLSGGFETHIYIEPLSTKLFQYGFKEQRDIYLISLKVTYEQKEKLIFMLNRNQFRLGRYYFLNENCASGIYALLNEIDLPLKQRNSFTFTPNNLANLIDQQFIEKVEILKSPHAQNKNSAEALVLSFYSDGKGHDDLTRINLERTKSFTFIKENAYQASFLDHKARFLYTKDNRFFAASFYDRGFLETAAESPAINEVTLLSPKIAERHNVYTFDSLTLIKFFKQVKTTPTTKDPLNGGAEIVLKEHSEINVRIGSSIDIPILMNSIFFDFGTNLINPELERTYLSFRYYDHLLRNLALEIHFNKSIKNSSLDNDHLNICLTWLLSSQIASQLFYNNTEQLSLGALWRF